MRMMYDQTIDNRPYKTGRWVAGDQGYGTFDTLSVEDEVYDPDSARSDEFAGFKYVVTKLRDHIFSETGVKPSLSWIDSQLGCDNIVINGVAIPIKEIRDLHYATICERAANLISENTAGGATGVLLVGGRADWLRDRLLKSKTAMPPITVALDHANANAIGAYYYCQDITQEAEA